MGLLNVNSQLGIAGVRKEKVITVTQENWQIGSLQVVKWSRKVIVRGRSHWSETELDCNITMMFLVSQGVQFRPAVQLTVLLVQYTVQLY